MRQPSASTSHRSPRTPATPHRPPIVRGRVVLHMSVFGALYVCPPWWRVLRNTVAIRARARGNGPAPSRHGKDRLMDVTRSLTKLPAVRA